MPAPPPFLNTLKLTNKWSKDEKVIAAVVVPCMSCPTHTSRSQRCLASIYI